MKRPADPTDEDDKEFKDTMLSVIGILLFFFVVFLFSGCASTPTIGECINGKVTWSDGTTERCKILKQSGSI